MLVNHVDGMDIVESATRLYMASFARTGFNSHPQFPQACGLVCYGPPVLLCPDSQHSFGVHLSDCVGFHDSITACTYSGNYLCRECPEAPIISSFVT